MVSTLLCRIHDISDTTSLAFFFGFRKTLPFPGRIYLWPECPRAYIYVYMFWALGIMVWVVVGGGDGRDGDVDGEN